MVAPAPSAVGGAAVAGADGGRWRIHFRCRRTGHRCSIWRRSPGLWSRIWDCSWVEPGRPVTSAPERATRDPGAFAALLTYGHPELDQALRELADDDTADSAAVVIAQDPSGVTALARADRSPAVMLRRVDELRELNVPHAAGEAEALAGRLAAEEARRREDRRQRWLGRSEARWHAHVRAEFCGLVRRVVGIDLLLGEREHGTKLDPILAWHALAQDGTTGWAYAEAFRRTLGLEIADLLPEGPLDTDASASARELR